MAYIELNVYSKVLNLEIPVTVIIPQFPKEPLKTIWLYHGSTGDHTLWARYTNLERYARERNLAVVIPTAHKSMFTNMVHGQDYGVFLGEELVQRLREIFPCLSKKREDNFVGGLSNGAYGCLRTGLRYPETFGAIGAFSGGDAGERYYTDDGTYAARRSVLVFGEGCPSETEHSVKWLARQLKEKGGQFPRIYHAAGELEISGQGDGMTEFFNDMPCEYQFEVFPGVGHEWKLWDQAVYKFIDEFLGIKPVTTKYYV
ncbi:MAG: transcriptional antiterminator [Firmicutes bacterium]|nr:transcriptional antiterminator [Bacillota bacterium]